MNSPGTDDVVVENVPTVPPLELTMMLHPNSPLFHVSASLAEAQVARSAPKNVELAVMVFAVKSEEVA